MIFLKFKRDSTNRLDNIIEEGKNADLLRIFLTDNFFSWADTWLEFLDDPNETDASTELTDLCKYKGKIYIKWFEDVNFDNSFEIPIEELKKIIREFVRLDKEGTQGVLIKSEDGEYYTIEETVITEEEIRKFEESQPDFMFPAIKFDDITIALEHILGIVESKVKVLRWRGLHHDLTSHDEETGKIKVTDKHYFNNNVYNACVSYLNEPQLRTFFPAEWPREKVMQAIHAALKDMVQGSKFDNQNFVFTGKTPEGIYIRMIVTPEGEMITAYPLVGRIVL